MTRPLFDFDLKRVSREHYITGKAAINFPRPETTTGGWHFLSYFDRESGVAKMSLAGIHYPDTMGFFGDEGIIDVTGRLAEFGWSLDGHRLFMADHYRATPRHDCEVGAIRIILPIEDGQAYLVTMLVLAHDKHDAPRTPAEMERIATTLVLRKQIARLLI